MGETAIRTTRTTDVSQTVGERIVMLLFRHGLTQQKLGLKTGIDGATISRKLKGRGRWYAEELIAIASTLETSVGYLLGETNDDRRLDAENPAAASATGSSSVAGERFELSTSRL